MWLRTYFVLLVILSLYFFSQSLGEHFGQFNNNREFHLLLFVLNTTVFNDTVCIVYIWYRSSVEDHA